MDRICLTFLFTILICGLFSCKSSNKAEFGFRGFDVSPDDKRILFSYEINGLSAIYEMDIETKEVRQLIASTAQKKIVNPKYSHDGKKIVFIEYNKNNFSGSKICIAESNGSNVRSLTKKEAYITEADFYNNDEQIVFTKAEEYGKASPIGNSTVHRLDIYTLGVESGKISKITNLGAYGLDHICVEGSTILFHQEGGRDAGIYWIFKNLSGTIQKITPLNNPRGDESLYYTPVYNDKYNALAFTAPYEIYFMKTDSLKATLVYDSKGKSDIDEIRFFNNSRVVLFNKVGESKFFSLSLENGTLEEVEVNINFIN